MIRQWVYDFRGRRVATVTEGGTTSLYTALSNGFLIDRGPTQPVRLSRTFKRCM
jgi:hypothetical protein